MTAYFLCQGECPEKGKIEEIIEAHSYGDAKVRFHQKHGFRPQVIFMRIKPNL